MLTSSRGAVPPRLRHVAEVELARSRRLGRPLSLLVLAREHSGQPSRRLLPARWRRGSGDLLRLSTMVEPHLRAYDSVIVDPGRRRISIVAPGATAADAEGMRARLEGVVGGAGTVRIGVVTFPDDGAFVEELVARADEEDRATTRTRPAHAPADAAGGQR